MYGPSLPATGGGMATVSLIWGIHTRSWLLIVMAIIIATITIISFIRLRRGEKKNFTIE